MSAASPLPLQDRGPILVLSSQLSMLLLSVPMPKRCCYIPLSDRSLSAVKDKVYQWGRKERRDVIPRWVGKRLRSFPTVSWGEAALLFHNESGRGWLLHRRYEMCSTSWTVYKFLCLDADWRRPEEQAWVLLAGVWWALMRPKMLDGWRRLITLRPREVLWTVKAASIHHCHTHTHTHIEPSINIVMITFQVAEVDNDALFNIEPSNHFILMFQMGYIFISFSSQQT